MAYGNPAPPPMDGPETGMDGDVPKAGASPMAKAFRLLRHALADGDDEAGGEAFMHACQIAGAHEEPDGDEGPEESMGGPKKPNLALILASKGKKD